MGVAQFKVICIFLSTFFERLISIVGNLAKFILHTPTTEPVIGTIDIVHLHTSIQIHDMVVKEYIVITGSSTEVPGTHLISGLVHDTTVRQY